MIPFDSFRRAIISKLLSFASSRAGNVAILFAFMLVPLLGCMGLAIDYGIALTNKTAMQTAADSAALAGARAAADYLSVNGSTSAAQAEAIKVGNDKAKSMYLVNTKLFGGVKPDAPLVSTKIVDDSPSVDLTAQYNFKPFFAPIFQVTQLPIGVAARSTLSYTQKYFQIIFLVDVSGSMGVGGDTSTISAMESNNSFKCAFACHDPNNYQGVKATTWADQHPEDYWVRAYGPNYCPWGNGNCPMVASTRYADKRALAASFGFKLKIDYVSDAIAAFMTQLSTYNTKNPGKYTVGINTYGSNADGPGKPFNILYRPNTNITAATTASKTIDMEAVTPVSTTNWGYTYTENGLNSTLTNLRNIGDGSSQTKMKTYVIFLSDGVQDTPGNQWFGRGVDTSYTAACDLLKKAGVNMFSIWTRYYKIPNEQQYDVLVKPLEKSMPAAMKSCASSEDQYFEANDGPGIQKAVSNTFDKILMKDLRLTN